MLALDTPAAAPSAPAPRRRPVSWIAAAVAVLLAVGGLSYGLTRPTESPSAAPVVSWPGTGVTLVGTGVVRAPFVYPAGVNRLVLEFAFTWSWAATDKLIQGFQVGLQEGEDFDPQANCYAIISRYADGMFGITTNVSVDRAAAGPASNPARIDSGTEHRVRMEMQQTDGGIAITGYLDGTSIGAGTKPGSALASLPLDHIQVFFFSSVEPTTQLVISDLTVTPAR